MKSQSNSRYSAECDLEVGINMKLRHDFSGHNIRPDIFQLHIDRGMLHIYNVHNSDDAPSVVGGSRCDADARDSRQRCAAGRASGAAAIRHCFIRN